jgi:predicted HicB family RNase H-like nuclease
MSALRYGDYQGAATYEDGRLVIQILHIEDTITTECDSASQAQAAFEELVKDYLETCKQVGKEPSKPFKGSFNVRISPALHKAVAMAAAEQGESLNSFVGRALEYFIEREKECEEVISATEMNFNVLSHVESSHVWFHGSTQAEGSRGGYCYNQTGEDMSFDEYIESLLERVGRVEKDNPDIMSRYLCGRPIMGRR